MKGLVKSIYNTVSRIRKRKVVGRSALHGKLDRVKKKRVKVVKSKVIKKWENESSKR